MEGGHTAVEVEIYLAAFAHFEMSIEVLCRGVAKTVNVRWYCEDVPT